MKIQTIYRRHMVYRALLLLTMLLCTVSYIHNAVSPYLRLFLVLGGLAAAADLLTNRDMWKLKDIWILILFWTLYLVTILCNGGVSMNANLKALCYMGLVFLTLYGGAATDDGAQAKKEQWFFGNLTLAGLFLLTAVSFATFVMGLHIRYSPTSTTIGYIGLYEGDRLAGLYNPNTGGALYAIETVLAGGLLFSRREKKLWLKIFYVLSMVLAVICLDLAYSRTSICGLAVITGAAVFWFWKPICTRLFRRGGLKDSMLLRLAGAAAVCALLILTVGPVRNAMSLITPLEEDRSLRTAAVQVAGTTDVMPETDAWRADANEVEQELSGRTVLWKAALKACRRRPMLGVTREAMLWAVGQEMPDKELMWSVEGGGVHNIYLTVLLCSGIAGFLCMFCFGLQKVFRLWKHRELLQAPGAALATQLLLVLLILMMEFFEGRILYQMNFFCVFFWMILGGLADEVRRNGKR